MAAPVTGQLTETVMLGGGLDLTTPALAVPPGRAIYAVNYEPEARGYRRIQGYERFSGEPKPSEASYVWMTFENGAFNSEEGPPAGSVVIGLTSGGQSTLVTDAILESGSWLDGTAKGGIAINDGGLIVGETLSMDPDLIAVGGELVTINLEPITIDNGFAATVMILEENAAPNDEDDRLARILVAELARGSITEPIFGDGPVRGIWGYAGSIWCARDSAITPSNAYLYKATTSGWSLQALGNAMIDFSDGVVEIVEGASINGQSSGATTTVQRIVLMSGTWSGGDAAGYLVVSGGSGAWTNGENIRVGTTVHAKAASTKVAFTLASGGRYQFVNHNFYGTADRRRMYFVNGVGYAHEWDGTTLVPIRHFGLAANLDKPTRVAVLANHLFLAYPGGALLFSEIGNPVGSRVDGGAGEIDFGDDVTDLVESASGALIVFGKTKIGYIEGTDAETFTLRIVSDDAGAEPWTAQNASSPIYLDKIGIRTLRAVQDYGNWRAGTISDAIEPLFRNKRRLDVGAVASLRVRAKDQYRLFFSDGTGITAYLGRKTPELMTFALPFAVFCTCSTDEGPSGAEELYVADQEGMVYQLDSGQNFDGAEIKATVRLPFSSQKSPTTIKRYMKATLEVDASARTSIALTAEFAYAGPGAVASPQQNFDVRGGGGFWDEANWNQFYWSAPYQGIANAYISGIGQNCSITVLSRATYEDPHTLSALTIHFSPRRQIR